MNNVTGAMPPRRSSGVTSPSGQENIEIDTFDPYADLTDNETEDDDPDQPLNFQPSNRTPIQRREIILLGFLLIGWFLAIIIVAIIRLSSQSHQAGSATSHRQGDKNPTAVVNWSLNFPLLYPPISSRPQSECHQAWGTLSSIPCHGKLVERAWNDGDDDDNNGTPHFPSLDRDIPSICDERCGSALTAARELISQKCATDDRFIILDGDYHQSVLNTKYLESGPVAELDVLFERRQRICRMSRNGKSGE